MSYIYLYYMDMYISKVRQMITQESRIVLSKSEKSLIGRAKKAQDLSNAFQKRLLKYPSGTFSFDALKKMILSLEGLENVSLNIQQLDREDCGAYIKTKLEVFDSYNGDYDLNFFFSGFTMKFKEKEGLVSNVNGDIVHETRHLLDHLCFPKTLLLSNPEQWFDKNKTAKFREVKSFIMNPSEYKPKKILGFIKIHTFEKELKEKIKDFDNITAINFLQKTRYQVQSEINAYNDYMCYYSRQIMQNPKLLIGIPKYYLGNRNEFEFSEKMRVMKKIIKELIQEERTKIKLA